MRFGEEDRVGPTPYFEEEEEFTEEGGGGGVGVELDY